MSRLHWLTINGAVLTTCAVFFDFALRSTLLTGLMLFLPILDKHWLRPELRLNITKLGMWAFLVTTGASLVVSKPDYANFAVTSLLLVALPEEWFFRAYAMRQIQSIWNKPWTANIVTSVLFSLLHFPTQGWLGLSVFLPSLFYGWLYQRTGDLILLILLHALSNLIFIMFIVTYFRQITDLFN